MQEKVIFSDVLIPATLVAGEPFSVRWRASGTANPVWKVYLRSRSGIESLLPGTAQLASGFWQFDTVAPAAMVDGSDFNVVALDDSTSEEGVFGPIAYGGPRLSATADGAAIRLKWPLALGAYRLFGASHPLSTTNAWTEVHGVQSEGGFQFADIPLVGSETARYYRLRR